MTGIALRISAFLRLIAVVAAVIVATAAVVIIRAARGLPQAVMTSTALAGESLPAGWGVQIQGPSETAAPQHAHAPFAAFSLAAGESLSPRIAPASFTAVYSGDIRIDETGDYEFEIDASGGTATLKLFGAGATLIGETGGSGTRSLRTALKPGTIVASVTFRRNSDSPAHLRTRWALRAASPGGYPLEAIPPSQVSVSKFVEDEVRLAMQEQRGRRLITQLGCVSCHPAPASLAHRVEGPRLAGVGARVSATWLRGWIADPHSMRPGTSMPDVIGTSARDAADADAIAAYLSRAPRGSIASPAKGDAAHGRALYHTVGCVSCHGGLESAATVFGNSTLSTDPAPAPVLDFGTMSNKWNPGALSRFLRDPAAERPSGRMPSLGLSVSEADAVAAYLVSRWNDAAAAGAPGEPAPESLVSAGRKAFAARGCASCHVMEDAPALITTDPASKLRPAHGCLDPADTASPRYALSDSDRAAIQLAISMIGASETFDAPSDAGARTWALLSCGSCHAKDGAGGAAPEVSEFFVTAGTAELGDEGRIPPSLTGVGAKLKREWLREVVSEGARVRPYMGVRMPRFGAPGEVVAASLKAESGAVDDAATHADVPGELVLAGRRLSGDNGLNCINCHAFGPIGATTKGPDMTTFHSRIRREWFEAFLAAPSRQKPGTRMPAFYATGRGAVVNIFNGDPTRQVEAMWGYLSLGAKAPAPTGLAGAEGMPVRIGERPRVFRGTLDSTNLRGIAVGFPIGVHVAFDADACRLARVWRGGFLDAANYWTDRGNGPPAGMGDATWTASGESPIRSLSADAAVRFFGYSNDAGGVPIFRYRLGELDVTERFEPSSSGDALVRTLSVTGGGFVIRAYGEAEIANGAPAKASHERGEVLVAPVDSTKAVVVTDVIRMGA